MYIVLDTNVLVSGLHNPFGAPGRIVDLFLAGSLHVLYDDRILNEYLDVLSRPQLGIDPVLAQSVVHYLRLSGKRVSALPLPAATLPDPDDLMFAEVAATGVADALVTGNNRHFTGLEQYGINVLSPAAFLEGLTSQLGEKESEK
jgi:putative PIN family toxin of toxin-antitoxin system